MPGLPLRDASVPDRKLGYGPNSRLPVKIATRNSAVYRDPATILIDRKDVYFDGELETVESPMAPPKLIRKDFMLGLNLLGTRSTIPMSISTKIICAARSEIIPGYCGKDLDAMLDRQSLEAIRPNVRNWYGKSTPSCSGIGRAR